MRKPLRLLVVIALLSVTWCTACSKTDSAERAASPESSVSEKAVAVNSAGTGNSVGSANAHAGRPNVILIVLDTLRADHLGVYGYSRDTSPNLDRLAREALLFEYAVTVAPWTPPSLATMFTGLYATSHGMVPPPRREEARKNLKRLDEFHTTAAEIFQKAGYKTVGLTPNPWLSKEFGFDQGFDEYYFHLRAPAEKITRGAVKVIGERADSGEPFFLYLHYLDPHDPYAPPGEFKDMFKGPAPERTFKYPEKMQEYLGLYDGEIRYMDTELEKVFQFLKERGLYENTALIIVGDHGEQFMEHGDHRHGFKLFNDELHVPLIVKPPGAFTPGRISETVSTIDVFPTLLSFAGLELPAGRFGMPLTDREAIKKRPGLYSEIHRYYFQDAWLRTDGHKLLFGTMKYQEPLNEPIENRVIGLYSRHTTYDEQASLDNPQLVDAMKKEFVEFKRVLPLFEALQDGAGQNDIEVSDEKLEELRSLGYIQ